MARKKLKRYDGEEGSFVNDSDVDYSTRGTGRSLREGNEEDGLHEVEYKPEPKTVNTFKQKVIPSNLFRGNEDIDEEDTSAYHGLPLKKNYLKNMPSPEKKQENADKIQKAAEIGTSLAPVVGLGRVGKTAKDIIGTINKAGRTNSIYQLMKKAGENEYNKVRTALSKGEEYPEDVAASNLYKRRGIPNADRTRLNIEQANKTYLKGRTPAQEPNMKKGGKVKRYDNGGDVANESTSGLSPQEFKENIAERRGFVEGKNKYPAEARLQKDLALPASLARKAGVYLQEKYGDVKGNVQGMLGDAEALRELRGRQFVRDAVLGYKKGGAVVRGHGIESRGKTKGRFV